MDTEKVYRLEEIQQEIGTLLKEAKGILRSDFPAQLGTAQSYWMAEIQMALGQNHGYLGKSGYSMDQTINAIWEQENE